MEMPNALACPRSYSYVALLLCDVGHFRVLLIISGALASKVPIACGLTCWDDSGLLLEQGCL